MQTEIYTLPTLTYVGGKSIDLRFNLKDSDGKPYDATGNNINFSICDYSNKIGEPIFSLTPNLIADENGIASILQIEIDPSYTLNLFGKFIYQIIFIDIRGRVEIPNQGIMNITRNINQDYLAQ